MIRPRIQRSEDILDLTGDVNNYPASDPAPASAPAPVPENFEMPDLNNPELFKKQKCPLGCRTKNGKRKTFKHLGTWAMHMNKCHPQMLEEHVVVVIVTDVNNISKEIIYYRC